FEVIVDPILDEFGKLAGAVHMMRDITAKIQAEKELSESEEKFRILYNNSPDMYVSVSPRDGSVLLCNETLLTKTGFSREEIIGHHVHNLYHEDCQDEVKEVFQEFVEKGIILDRELILKRKDGGRIEVSLNVDSVRGEEGEILYSISTWRDITERVLMVENLKKEKEFSEKIINTSNAIIVGLDKNHLIKIFNRGAEKITGHKSQDVLGKDWFKVFIPAEILGELDQVWEGAWGAPAHSYINPVRIKNGSERIISWQSTGMYDEEDTKNQLLISIGEDITERKQAENALLEREDELRLMINNSPAGFSRTDMKGHFMDVNPAMCLMVGYSKEELLSKHFNDISHPDDTEKNREIYQTLVDEKIEYFDLEKRYIHKNGKIVHVLIRSQLVRNYEGKPLFEFALIEDITERVLAEEEIQQRTEDLMLINTINDATNRGMDLMEILTLFDEEAKRVFSCKSTSVYLYNEDQNYIEMQNLNLAPDLVKRIEKLIGTNLPDIRIPIEERSYTWELLMTEGPCLINDSETIQQWMLEFTNIFGLAEKTRPVIRKLIAQIYKLVNIQSLITVPMISAGKTVGLMDISRREPFTEQDKTRFASVVGQVTSAITSLRAKSEKTRNQNLLLTLSQAAPAINQANNADEIYRAIGEHAVKMDFDVTVFTLTDDRKYLAVAYHNLTGLARKAEKLTGLSERSYQFPLVLGGFYHKILMGKQAVFSQLDYDPLTEALPKVPRPVINKIMDLFGRQQSIIAPLTVRGEEFGLLSFSGSDLTRSDLPAITTFVNQAAIALEKIRLFTETKELAAFNEGIVQNMAEGIAIEDPDGIFTFVNPAGERLLGYQNGELVGKHWKTITPLDQQPLVLAQNKKRSQGESSQYEVD
ncbi:MAG: PAS domain S-box protein, partial [Anaerolineales bacterium]|nr:PAS domain S-box protein [Anaerolineales bacterium]